MASFQLVGITVGSGLEFDITSKLIAAICDTRGRNQNIGAEDAQNVGTSHYYLLIRTGDYRYFFVDSSRTNVQEISQENFIQHVNDNGIVIFMRNRVEQEVPQQVAKISSQSPPSVRKHSAGGGGGAVPAPAALPCRKHSAGAAAASCPHPPQRFSASGGGAAAVPHQPPPSFGHMQSHQILPSFMEKLKNLFPTLAICHYFANPVVYSGTYEPTEEDKKNYMCLLASVRHDAIASDKTASPFVYLAPKLTYEDVSQKHRLVASFDINKQSYRLVAVVYSDDYVVACPKISSLSEKDRGDLRKSFHSDIKEYLYSNSGTTINKLLFVPCV